MYHSSPSPYELSPDLIERQLTALEKKYGGAEKAKKAALTIQRAFRRYSMDKKFTQMKAEKRVSRRLDPPPSSSIVARFSTQKIATQMQSSRLSVVTAAAENISYEDNCYSTNASSSSSPPDIPKRTVSIVSGGGGGGGGGGCGGGGESSPNPRSKLYQQQQQQQQLLTQQQHHHHHHHHHHHPSPQYLKRQQPPSLLSSPLNDCRLSTKSCRIGSGGGGGGGGVSSCSAVVVSGSGCNSDNYSVNEVIRKRHYRTGLNIFNKKPEKGISYLIRRGFLENSPQAVARFLISRKGLSKQMIGEYLGNLTYSFNMAVLNCFACEMDFSGMFIDSALRKFQTYFRMPGEAQKIERLMEIFSNRYMQCNPDIVAKLHSPDTIFILAFAIILLNTDLHTPNIKPEKRMKLDDFTKNLRNIDDGHDLDPEWLTGIYQRILSQEFRPGSDHVTQVMKVQQTIVAKCPNLAVPHRRLVCYCRLYEVHDPMKKERPGIHQREVFLFNDILVITKIHSRRKNTVTYTFRESFLLAGMMVSLFETQFYPFGIQVAQKWDRKIVLTLNARNEHDRSKFVEDLKESIAEMDEMEALRLEAELEKQRDSGITSDTPTVVEANKSDGIVLRKSAINNSLLDLNDQTLADKMSRRGSVGSLDSGMSISFQSTSVGSISKTEQRFYHPRHK